jgi:YidC/Oxa1 family membrane protein insertase
VSLRVCLFQLKESSSATPGEGADLIQYQEKKMDLVRAFLIFTIGAILYYLLLQWPANNSQSTKEIDTGSFESNIINESKDSLTTFDSAPQEGLSVFKSTENKTNYSDLVVLENNTLKLTLDGNTGRIISSVLKGIKVEKNGQEDLKIFGQLGQSEYFANSGFFTRSKGYLNPNLSLDRSYDADLNTKVFEFSGDSNGLKHFKKITLTEGLFSAIIEDVVSGPLGNTPVEVTPYVVIERGNDETGEGGLAYTYLGPVFSTELERFEKYDFDDIDDEAFKRSSKGGWASLIQHYFLSAWVPDQEKSYLYQARKSSSGNRYSIGYTGVSETLDSANTKISQTNTLYVGPKLPEQLKAIHQDLDLTVDYGFLWWMGKPMYWLLNVGHDLFKNWGLAIIFLTILLKVLTWPLSAAAYKSMGKMRVLQPKLAAMQAQFGDDKQKAAAAMMEFYKKEGVNPLGGCLPMVIQMPFFLAFYWVLMETVELRHSPFFFWIDDLSAKDPYFILPLLNAAGMYFSQKLTPTPANADPMQAQMMKYFPLVFALIFAWFPSGLVLYWLMNMLVTLLQQWWYYRKVLKS